MRRNKILEDDEDDEFSNSYKTESTANDAIGSKFSAISLKYYEDSFLKLMFEAQARSFVRKPPIINRGYYVRVKAFEHIVNRFLEATSSCSRSQVISLGGGFDTLPYKLLTSDAIKSSGSRLKYFEVDFPNVVRKKAAFTLKKQVLSQLLPDLLSETGCDSDQAKQHNLRFQTAYGYDFGSYALLSGDLQDTGALSSLLREGGVDPSLPTLLLTECVLVYMSRESTQPLLALLADLFTEALWLSYDMMNPSDKFGSMMLSNLSRAGHKIPGFTDYPTLQSHRQRFLEAGWPVSRACSMLRAYDDLVSEQEKQRLNSLEILDEVEEWQLIMQHYALTLAAKGSSMLSLAEEISDEL
ncbi:unnamed protein product [Sphagnum jensenii]|uniref:Leucine carboxyl methyltransferase 1 homolog n=1 Tax=Sphagnum jensenii TaxID=128206 RepID=A0ABP0VD25_9BRYO